MITVTWSLGTVHNYNTDILWYNGDTVCSYFQMEIDSGTVFLTAQWDTRRWPRSCARTRGGAATARPGWRSSRARRGWRASRRCRSGPATRPRAAACPRSRRRSWSCPRSTLPRRSRCFLTLDGFKKNNVWKSKKVGAAVHIPISSYITTFVATGLYPRRGDFERFTGHY